MLQLRKGDCYAQNFEIKRNSFKIVLSRNTGFKLTFIFLLLNFLLFRTHLALAQDQQLVVGSEPLDVRELNIGDTIPDHIWNLPLQLEYADGRTIETTFGSLRGKLLIIDFWSTGCPSCIAGFPKMEGIQKRYEDKVAVILPNSKRNKDTPEKIKRTFDRYREDKNYELSLPFIASDTILTALFPHNTIPNIVWISKEGVLLGQSHSIHVNHKNIEYALTTGKAGFRHKGTIFNKDRADTPPLIDTTDNAYIRAFAPFVDGYLARQPAIERKNQSTLFQMANVTLITMLYEAFQNELEGLEWTDFIFDPNLGNDIKKRLFSTWNEENVYWYEFYSRDSIPSPAVYAILKEDFKNYFHIDVERRQDSIDTYQVDIDNSLINAVELGGMRKVETLEGYPILFENFSLVLVLNRIATYFDRPVIFDRNDIRKVTLKLPAEFPSWDDQRKIAFLKTLGIKFNAHRDFRRFAYIYKTN